MHRRGIVKPQEPKYIFDDFIFSKFQSFFMHTGIEITNNPHILFISFFEKNGRNKLHGPTPLILSIAIAFNVSFK